MINIQEKYPKPSSLIIVKKIGISVKMNRKLFHLFLSEVFKSEKLFEKIFHVQDPKKKLEKFKQNENVSKYKTKKNQKYSKSIIKTSEIF